MAALGVSSAPRGPTPEFWRGARVLVTGHTGFKGSWLVRWLHLLGAEVHGLALDPITEPALYDVARVADVLASDARVDLRDPDGVLASVEGAAPEIVLHLAAQPLVRASYRDPAGTFATNVTGTAHLLSALRSGSVGTSLRAAVVVTSDKVYRTHADGPGERAAHREDSELGGHDPYSASKAMVEHLVASYRVLPAIDAKAAWHVPMATARAGNVIGGGDWSHDRLIPDCIRAFDEGRPVMLRYPEAVRPWQHVLDPLAGYLVLAEHLATDPAGSPEAVNFGPGTTDDVLTVRDVATSVARLWGVDGALISEEPAGSAPETGVLRIDSTLATESLGWRPTWTAATALERTVDWYRAHRDGADMAALTDRQIAEYSGG